MIRHELGVALLAPVLFACQGGPTIACGPGELCALHPTLVVTGHVQASLNPLPGVRVTVTAFRSGCAGDTVLLLPSPAEAVTDAGGQYTMELEPQQAAAAGCVEVAYSSALRADTPSMPPPPDRRRRLAGALLCLGLALALAYIARTAPAGLRLPAGVVYLGAATYAAAGAALLLQALGHVRAQAGPVFLMGAGMTGIAAWVAFGPGPRRCQASFGGFGFIPPELFCRVAFGIGALLLGLIAWLMLRPLVQRHPGKAPR
jgi:hypothetical protein